MTSQLHQDGQERPLAQGVGGGCPKALARLALAAVARRLEPWEVRPVAQRLAVQPLARTVVALGRLLPGWKRPGIPVAAASAARRRR